MGVEVFFVNYVEEIKKLKKEKNAIILAHYYQNGEIQDIADYLGDSLKLSMMASQTDAKIIVFCGVHFMAETAKILSPEKKVLIPVMEAGCKMANMIDEVSLGLYKENHPDTKVLCYVNSTAKVKALSDCCVTSSNALKIIDHYLAKGEKILYCPDRNLAKYAMKLRNVSFDCWDGDCCIHDNLNRQMVVNMKALHPDALVAVHPEARLEVLEEADYVGSTAGIIDFVKKSDAKAFIVGTEEGILHKLKNDNPGKEFFLLDEGLRCHDMKLTTLKDVYEVLKNETNEVNVEESVRANAYKALDTMLKLS